MTPGRHTSEFWLSAFWSVKAAAALAALLTVACHCWQAALIAAPAVCLLIHMAAAIANNYGENRFLLKNGGGGEDDAAPQQERRAFGFGRRVLVETEEEKGEEDE